MAEARGALRGIEDKRQRVRLYYALNEIRESEVETDTAGPIYQTLDRQKQPDSSYEPHQRIHTYTQNYKWDSMEGDVSLDDKGGVGRGAFE